MKKWVKITLWTVGVLSVMSTVFIDFCMPFIIVAGIIVVSGIFCLWGLTVYR